jgi:hypothetical protein
MTLEIRGNENGDAVHIVGARMDVDDPDVDFPIAGVTASGEESFVVLSHDGRVKIDVGLLCVVMTYDKEACRWHAELSESGEYGSEHAPLSARVDFFAYSPTITIESPDGVSVEVDAQ